MANHIAVVCGLLSHDIYAATVDDLGNAEANLGVVTKDAIRAVRDYMVDDIPNGKSSIGYAWKRKDGKTVYLTCTIKGDVANGDDNVEDEADE